VPARDGAGKLIRWYGTNTDIEEFKFFHGNACTADQGTERSSVALSMIGHRQMTAVWMVQDDVASLLPVEDKTDFPKDFDRVAAGDDRVAWPSSGDADLDDIGGRNG
jgi:hypothetical protein